MSDSGWTSEDQLAIPEVAIKMAVQCLRGRQGVCEAHLELLKSSLAKVWSRVFRPTDAIDRNQTQFRFEEISRQADELDKLSNKLASALGNLSKTERELLDDLLENPSSNAIAFLSGFSARPLSEVARGLAEDFSRERGNYERIDGRIELFVSELAKAWPQVFDRKPSAKPDGLFASVVNEALRLQADIEGGPFKPLGRDALRRSLRGG